MTAATAWHLATTLLFLHFVAPDLLLLLDGMAIWGSGESTFPFDYYSSSTSSSASASFSSTTMPHYGSRVCSRWLRRVDNNNIVEI